MQSLKYADTLVTFAEVPDEITLCISFSNCPIHCPGCHSKYLWEDTGEEFSETVLDNLLSKNPGISCVCFMGGDLHVQELSYYARYIQENYKLKVAWYTGQTLSLPIQKEYWDFDYIKDGPYREDRGPLNVSTTNQRFFMKVGTSYVNITEKFQVKR